MAFGSLLTMLVIEGFRLNKHTDRCFDVSHGDYIWDEGKRRAACD